MKNLKKFVPVLLALILVFASVGSAFACTGIWVGSQLSENGSTFMGRSEDIGDLYGKVFEVSPAKDHNEGDMYADAYGFTMPWPKHTYSYTYVRDSYEYGECLKDENGKPYGEPYGAAGMNEKGVYISATVSTRYSAKVKEHDPCIETGICEISIPTVVLGTADTAREGVKILAKIIDEYGAGECNAIVIGDANEAWYMEICSGHQYAAIKLPQDKIGLNPNIMLLGEVDVNDKENVIASEGLIETAEDNGFLMTGENGLIHVAHSYCGISYGSSRFYQGLFLINPEEAAKHDLESIKNKINPVQLLNDPTPGKKLSTYEILRMLAYRGEGSAIDSNKIDERAIGVNRQSECHFFETRANMPAELATIEWLAMADAEFSIYLPYYGALLTETQELYHVGGGYVSPRITPYEEQIAEKFFENSINWNFQYINYYCDTHRNDFDTSKVKELFANWQKSLIEQQKAVDAEMVKIYNYDKGLAKEKATELGKDIALQTYDLTAKVLSELKAYIEAEDYDKPFTPTALTENKLPEYSLTRIGGTGITAAPVEPVHPKSPATGDQANMIVWLSVALLACAGLGAFKAYRENSR